MSVDRTILFRLATSAWLERVIRAVPGGEDLAWRAASRYAAGRTVEDAVRVAGELHARAVACSLDQFGELADDPEVAQRVADDYLRLTGELTGLPADAWLAIDLSHLGIDVDPHGCADQLAAIARALPEGRRIQIGAEDARRAGAVLDCVLEVAGRGLADRLGATAQANLHRTPEDVERLLEARLHIRLVKGAYVEPPDRALPYGEPTDIAYLHVAHRLAAAEAPFALATHDGVIREALLAALGPVPVAQLLGGYDLTSSTTSRLVVCQSACTYPSATAGSATGCAGSPNHVAPKVAPQSDADARTCRSAIRRDVAGLNYRHDPRSRSFSEPPTKLPLARGQPQ